MKKKMRALILYFQIFNLIPIVLYIQKMDIKFTLKNVGIQMACQYLFYTGDLVQDVTQI